MVEVASKMGRLASGMATDKTEVTGEEGGPIRVEVEAALDKIYGKPIPGEVVDVQEVRNAECGVQSSGASFSNSLLQRRRERRPARRGWAMTNLERYLEMGQRRCPRDQMRNFAQVDVVLQERQLAAAPAAVRSGDRSTGRQRSATAGVWAAARATGSWRKWALTTVRSTQIHKQQS